MAKVDGIVAVGIAKAITTRRLKTAGVPTIHIISSTTNGKAMFFNSTVPKMVLLNDKCRVPKTMPAANPAGTFTQ